MKKRIDVRVVLLLQVVFLLFGFQWNKITNAGVYTDVFNTFVDMPSIVCMLCFIVPGVFVMGIGKDLIRAFSVGRKKYALMELKGIYEALKCFQKLNRLGASLVVMIGLIWCMNTAYGNAIESIGPCLVVCFLPLFYGFVAEYLLLPLIINVQKEMNGVMTADEED